MKTSIEVPDELMNKIKEYNLIHKGRPINMSGMFQECLERIFNKEQSHDKIKSSTEFETIKNIESDPEIIIESSLSLEVMRQKWWDDKQIGISIAKAGGIGIINLKNIIQKNPDLFETKEECRAWLYNKLKTYPPLIETETPKIQNKLRKPTAVNMNMAEEPPKFTPNRVMVKCPGCGEEHLEISSSPTKKCVNCGFNGLEDNTKPQSDQHAPAQDEPPSPPQEVK